MRRCAISATLREIAGIVRPGDLKRVIMKLPWWLKIVRFYSEDSKPIVELKIHRFAWYCMVGYFTVEALYRYAGIVGRKT